MNEQKKILIVIGAAPCVREDIADFLSLRGGSQTPWQSLDPAYAGLNWMAIGLDAVNIVQYPIQYFASYHPYEIEEAKERRAKTGGNTDYMIISHVNEEVNGLGEIIKYDVNLTIPIEPPSGSSALLGVLAGIKLGYEKIIVCGCPLTGKNTTGYDYAEFRVGWTAKLSEIKAFTRSMSGWTKELLGEPTIQWLED